MSRVKYQFQMIVQTILDFLERKIRYLTLFAFSSENWLQRDKAIR